MVERHLRPFKHARASGASGGCKGLAGVQGEQRTARTATSSFFPPAQNNVVCHVRDVGSSGASSNVLLLPVVSPHCFSRGSFEIPSSQTLIIVFSFSPPAPFQVVVFVVLPGQRVPTTRSR